jgi:hypothetical protein
MTRRSIAAVVALLSAAQPALSQTVSSRETPAESRSCVPPRTPDEAYGAYEGRARQYCEARWSDLVSHGATGRWKHPDWVENCLRRCRAGDWAGNAAPILSAAAGVALATAAAIAASGPPANTPASP